MNDTLHATPPLVAAKEPGCPSVPGATEAGQASIIRLPPALDLLAAEPLRQQLLAAIEVRQSIGLVGDEVDRFSTPCAQVLIAAARAAEAAGVTFSLMRPSPELVAAFDDLGLTGLLSKWMAMAPDRDLP